MTPGAKTKATSSLLAMRNRVQGLRYVKGSDLAADPRNWRQHPPAQRQALQSMIDRVGLVDAVIAREAPDGSLVLVDGHLRADLDPEVELPVLVVDLTEEEAGEVLASFDPLSAMAQADVDALKALVDTIPPQPEMLALPIAPIDCTDNLIDPLENPTSKPGDLYLLGRHRLLCGNSAKAEDVERLLDGAKPNLMVTDPPYGVEYDADWTFVELPCPAFACLRVGDEPQRILGPQESPESGKRLPI